jgi:hypothetical protein
MRGTLLCIFCLWALFCGALEAPSGFHSVYPTWFGVNTTIVVIHPAVSAPEKSKPKLDRQKGFLNLWKATKAELRAANRKIKGGDESSPADRKARRSVTLGILANASLALAILLPLIGIDFFLIGVLAVPFGILAVTKAARARREGSKRPTGLVLGITALSLFTVGLIFAIALVVSLTGG